MEYKTDRIRFLPVTLDLAQVLMKNPLAFYYQYQLPWNKSWPHDGLKALLPLYVERLEESGEQFGFGPWIMIDRGGEYVIGDIGFKGVPDDDGVVNIGYHVVESKRGAGYATEAVEGLCDWVFSNQSVKAVEAQCDQTNVASQKVLINNGFSHTGESDGLLVFKKETSDHKKHKSKGL